MTAKHLGSQFSGQLILIVVLLQLVGCGSVELRQKPDSWISYEAHSQVPGHLLARLAEAPDCCTSLAELPYQNIEKSGILTAEIGINSPAYPFESGKSFFAAYRIDELPRPFALRIASRLTFDPTSLVRFLGGPGDLVFSPVVLILDNKFRIQKTIAPGVPPKSCGQGGGNTANEVFTTSFDISGKPEQEKYIVVITTDAQRSRDGETLCGIIRHGLSPVGNLSLTITSFDFHDGSMHARSAAKWYPDTKDPGIFAGLFQTPGLLILGDSALHYLDFADYHYAERLSIPYAKIASFPRRNRQLVIGTQEQPGDNTRYQSFNILPFAFLPFDVQENEPDKDIFSQLAARIRPELSVDRIGYVVTKNTPLLEFQRGKEDSAISRIGEWATVGGVATALPCGVCAGGLCTPEMLAPCAALFSVGAVVGGTLGVGHEIATTVIDIAAPGVANPREVKQSMAPMVERTRAEQTSQMQLMSCLKLELDKKTNASWRDQGHIARLSEIVPMDSITPGTPEFQSSLLAQGYQYSTESFISRVALVPQEQSAKTLAEVPVRLLIEGEVIFRNLADNRKTITSQVSWESQPHALGEWTSSGPQLAGEAINEGCHELAKKIVEASKQNWSQQ